MISSRIILVQLRGVFIVFPQTVTSKERKDLNFKCNAELSLHFNNRLTFAEISFASRDDNDDSLRERRSIYGIDKFIYHRKHKEQNGNK